MQPQRAAQRRAVPSVRASARERNPRNPRYPRSLARRARPQPHIMRAVSPPEKGRGYREGVGQTQSEFIHSMGHAAKHHGRDQASGAEQSGAGA